MTAIPHILRLSIFFSSLLGKSCYVSIIDPYIKVVYESLLALCLEAHCIKYACFTTTVLMLLTRLLLLRLLKQHKTI